MSEALSHMIGLPVCGRTFLVRLKNTGSERLHEKTIDVTREVDQSCYFGVPCSTERKSSRRRKFVEKSSRG
jgi:hypothetical protein